MELIIEPRRRKGPVGRFLNPRKKHTQEMKEEVKTMMGRPDADWAKCSSKVKSERSMGPVRKRNKLTRKAEMMPRELLLLPFESTKAIMNKVVNAFKILSGPFPNEFMHGAETVAFVENAKSDTQALVFRNPDLKQVMFSTRLAYSWQEKIFHESKRTIIAYLAAHLQADNL